jgi:hypothetical protein
MANPGVVPVAAASPAGRRKNMESTSRKGRRKYLFFLLNNLFIIAKPPDYAKLILQ